MTQQGIIRSIKSLRRKMSELTKEENSLIELLRKDKNDNRIFSINLGECFVCKRKTHFFKWSMMGSFEIFLCDKHKNKEPYLSFGPKGIFDHTEIGVH